MLHGARVGKTPSARDLVTSYVHAGCNGFYRVKNFSVNLLRWLTGF